MTSISLLLISMSAGFLGSLLGLGGGIIIVPALTIFFKIDIHYAIASSLVSVIATSVGSSGAYVKNRLTNIRIAVILEIGTVSGALCGFLISSWLNAKWLTLLFASFLLFTFFSMLRKKHSPSATKSHPWAEKLKLNSTYTTDSGTNSKYHVSQIPFGIFIMYIAGILSAILGIGSGIFKVLAMDHVMKLPFKISSATSSFMIGVTACASAGAYFFRGDIRPEIAGPVALGILVGSFIGPKLISKFPTSFLKKLFMLILLLAGIQMFIKGLGL